MADLNVFVFTARLTQDASTRTLASGKKVTSMSAAVNTGFGEYKKALFIKIQMWGDRGEKLRPYLKKGQLVGGDGELSRSEWSSSEGKTYVDFVVNAMDLQLLGSKSDSKQQSDSSDEEEGAPYF